MDFGLYWIGIWFDDRWKWMVVWIGELVRFRWIFEKILVCSREVEIGMFYFNWKCFELVVFFWRWYCDDMMGNLVYGRL